jgi:hypothetical protein
MGQIREHEATQYPLHGIASLAWQADQRARRFYPSVPSNGDD